MKEAYEFIIQNIRSINYLLDPELFFTENLYILSWTEANRINGCDDFFSLKKKKAEAGTRRIRGTNSYLTIYDDTLHNKDRIRFTKAHELGHIILGHLDKYDKTALNRGGVTKKEYHVLEYEADFFASQILSPIPLIQLLGLTRVDNIKDIRRIFQISLQAAGNRFVDILWHEKWNLYTEYIPKFKELFYNRIKYYNLGYSCSICNHMSTKFDKAISFCPVCGKNKFIKINDIKMGEFDFMKYKGIEIDSNGRPLICPKCKNEEILDGDFCKICGMYLINKCTETWISDNGSNYTQNSCGTICDGNARYCHKCGNETTYFQNCLLEKWDKEDVDLSTDSSFNPLEYTIDD